MIAMPHHHFAFPLHLLPYVSFIISYLIVLSYLISYHIISHPITSYHIASFYIILYRTTIYHPSTLRSILSRSLCSLCGCFFLFFCDLIYFLNLALFIAGIYQVQVPRVSRARVESNELREFAPQYESRCCWVQSSYKIICSSQWWQLLIYYISILQVTISLFFSYHFSFPFLLCFSLSSFSIKSPSHQIFLMKEIIFFRSLILTF